MSDGYRWKALGARIREARVRAGLTQKRLAELVGVRAHTAWCWEAGRMRPQRENLVAIAHHTGTSPEQIEGRDAGEAEVLREAERAFRDAIEGLPTEDIASIRNYIRFLKAEPDRSSLRGGSAASGSRQCSSPRSRAKQNSR